MRSLIPLSLLLTIFDSPVHGYVFPFHVRFNTESTSLTRRSPIPVGNIGNAQYVSNITVAGEALAVLLDTGSSDLWVHFPSTAPTSNMKDTGKSITLSYAVGAATGNVQTSQVNIGNLSMSDQAFLWVNDTSSFTSDIHSQGYDGLLGLGPNQSSVIRKKVGDDSANTVLQRTFTASNSTSNYITLLLDRKKDPAQTLTGQFTVSEVVSGFENITSMPKLDVDTVNRLLKSDQHWQALTDKATGIIGPDGNPIQVKSIVPNAPSKTYVAVIDSGFTFSQVPRDVSDAIYGRVRGAVYDTKNEWWLIPCGQYLNVSFSFGGVTYPIHPLDLVDDNFGKVDSTGKKVCIGAFQPITSAFSLLGHYDMILGMSFLRNAYALLDFGYWISDAGDSEHPFMQMVPLVDSAAARDDFVQVRLAGNSSALSDPKYSLLSTAEMQHSPVSAEEKKKKYQEYILSRWPYIFVGCLAFVLIVTGLVVWKCCCQRKKYCFQRKAKNAGLEDADIKSGFGKFGFGNNQKGVFPGHAKRDSYVPLEAHGQSTTDLVKPYSNASNGRNSPHPSHYSQNYDQSYNSSTANLTTPYPPSTPHSPHPSQTPQYTQNYEQNYGSYNQPQQQGNYNQSHSSYGYNNGYQAR